MLTPVQGAIFFVLEIIVVIVFATKTEYNIETRDADQVALYKTFQDVNVMIFIGFGFLMTFLKSHSWSSVAFNMLISAWAVQVGILFVGLWENILCDEHCHEKIPLDISWLTRGDFAAGAVMITFGAVLGKVTGFQLVILTILEMFFYGLNEAIVVKMEANDTGGSMLVHAFGAFFGVGVSLVYSPKNAGKSKHCGDSYVSNLFAAIGTIFLWMYWPSFNGALAHPSQQNRVFLNTVFALIGSCIFTFIFSGMMNKGKFKMEDILNATLAGGVIIGTSSDLCRNAFVPFLIGGFGGIVSTVMYNKVSPFLQEKNILHDTCGVLNLHGVPGFLGGIFGAINIAVLKDTSFTVALEEAVPGLGSRSKGDQAGQQIAALFISVGISLVSGILTGLVIKVKAYQQKTELDELFDDKQFWEMEEEEDDNHDTKKPYVDYTPSNNAKDIEMRHNVPGQVENLPAKANNNDLQSPHGQQLNTEPLQTEGQMVN